MFWFAIDFFFFFSTRQQCRLTCLWPQAGVNKSLIIRTVRLHYLTTLAYVILVFKTVLIYSAKYTESNRWLLTGTHSTLVLVTSTRKDSHLTSQQTIISSEGLHPVCKYPISHLKQQATGRFILVSTCSDLTSTNQTNHTTDCPCCSPKSSVKMFTGHSSKSLTHSTKQTSSAYNLGWVTWNYDCQ